MTLTQKFQTLTTEQKEQFKAVKDDAALDAFASEYSIDLTAEQKADAQEYFKTGVLSLDDEELDNVAGGGCGSGDPDNGSTYLSKAQKDGRLISIHFAETANKHLCGCGSYESGPATPKFARSQDIKVLGDHDAIKYYFDVKCYKCQKIWGVLEYK